MPSFVKFLKTALVAAPLLVSCGGSTNTSPAVIGPNGLILPDCTEGQLLTADATGTLTCAPALAGMLQPPAPPCIPDSGGASPDGQALTVTVDGVSGIAGLTCVNKGTGNNDAATSNRITTASTKIMNLQTSLSTITNGGGNRAKFVGVTATTNGNFGGVGSAIRGPAEGAKLCDAVVTGAHLCSPMEIYESVLVGDKLNQTTPAAFTGTYLVYMQAYAPNAAGRLSGDEPQSSQASNCGAGTYETGHHSWYNTTVTFSAPAGSTIRIPQFNTAPCGTAIPLACCK